LEQLDRDANFRPTATSAGTCGILTALSSVNNETKIPNVSQGEIRLPGSC